MHSLTRRLALLLLLHMGLSGICYADSASDDADLWAAARAGDLQRVEALLKAGEDLNAKTRYGKTPLYFAAANGQMEVMEFLIEKGATIDDREFFLQRSPLDAALDGPHTEVAVRLIEEGALEGTYTKLVDSVRNGWPDVAAAVIAQGPVLDFEKSAALALAREAGSEELVALLEKAEVRAELPAVKLEAAEVEQLVGFYRDRDGGVAEVRLDEGKLVLHPVEGEPIPLTALNSRHFRAPSDHGQGAFFLGRLGIIEWMRQFNGNETLFYRRFEPDTFAEMDAAEMDVAGMTSAEVEVPRKAPISWGSFRGAGTAGAGDGQGVPISWDVKTGENVLWKTAIPGLAHASPVVWGDRVYVTTVVSAAGEPTDEKNGRFATYAGDDTALHTWKTLALDKATGEILWQRDAASRVPLTGRHPTSSQANATPATDGHHVVVVFPTAGMICYDKDGEVLWSKDLGGLNAGNYTDPGIHWGFASSPIIDDGRVILQADVHEGAFLAAYDVETGREIWKTVREEVSGWATPMVYRDDKHSEIVTNGPTIRGYDLETGKERWSLRPNSEQVVPTPITAHGLIYVTTGYPPAFPIYAVRPGMRGDLSLPDGATSSEAIAWSHARGGSYMVTPIVYRDLFYLPADGGRLTAYDALTGERIYRVRLSKRGNFTASPVAADGRLYLPTDDGVVYVIKAGRTYEEIALVDMEEPLTASPAISDGVLLLRTRRHLYALGEEGSGSE